MIIQVITRRLLNWSQFCDLSIEELSEAQNKRYDKEASTGILKDKDGVRVEWNRGTGKFGSDQVIVVPPKRTFKNINTPKPVKRGKGKIEKIQFGEHEQEVKSIWEGKPPLKLVQRWQEQGKKDQERYYNGGTPLARMNKIKLLIGYRSNLAGHCCKCYDLNTHLVKYRKQGITIIERYCSEHVPDKIK